MEQAYLQDGRKSMKTSDTRKSEVFFSFSLNIFSKNIRYLFRKLNRFQILLWIVDEKV